MAAIGTRKLQVEIDGVEHSASVSNARFTAGASDSDFTSFADAAGGGSRTYRLEGTAVQDAATGSIWALIWDAAGTQVPITLMPYGNALPSVTEPHFTATAIITEPDGDLLGGEANASGTAKMTVDFSWELTAKPTKVTV